MDFPNKAGYCPIEARRGDTFSFLITLQNPDGTAIDLTGATAVAKVKNKVGGTLIATMQTSDSTILIPSPTTGQLRLKLPYSVTELWTAGQWVWDLQITFASNDRYTILEGPFTVVGDVS